MLDTASQCKLPSRHGSIVRQRSSEHHVKMGTRHSCPRTPLKSASAAGLTSSVSRWQDSESEYDTSIQSLTDNKYTQSNEELHPALILPNPKPPNLDLSLDHILRSPTSTVTTTASAESSTNDSDSNYSNDSEQSEGSPDSSIGVTLQNTSLTIGRTSHRTGISSVPNFILPEPCTSPSATEKTDNSLNSPAGVRLTHPRPSHGKGSIESIKSKPRAHSTVIPSPMKESTKTIQVRRSFGQLLHFRRPAGVKVSLTGQASAFSNSNDTSSETEEKEELQTSVDPEHLHLGNESFRPWSRSPSIIGFNKLNLCKEEALETSDRSSTLSNDLEFCPESSDHPIPNSRNDASRRNLNRLRANDQPHSRPGSVLGGPKSLLKLVKSHSSLRQKIFRSMSQSSGSFQHDEIRQNHRQSSGVCGSNPGAIIQDYDHGALNDPINSRGCERESCRPNSHLEIQEQLDAIKPNLPQSPRVETRSAPKSPESNQSSSLKILNFWKKKKAQNPTYLNTKKVTTKVKSKDTQKNKKDTCKKNGKKTPIPLLDSTNSSNSSPRVIATSSLFNSNLKNSKQKYSEFGVGRARDVSCSGSSLVRAHPALGDMGSPPRVNEGYKSSTFDEGIQEETLETITQLNLPKPTRPPRKIPVTMRTVI